MRTHSLALAAALLSALLPSTTAFGWGCSRSFSGSGRYGGDFSHSGSTSGGWGNVSHSGSTSYTSPSGQSYSMGHSGSGSAGWGSASYSGSAYGPHGGTASYSGSVSGASGYHGAYYGYHGYAAPPPCCYGSYGSGFGAGMVTGAVVGAAAASAAKPSTAYVYTTPGVYVAPPPPTVVTAPALALPVGASVTVLPAGFTSEMVNGVQYYQAGSTWFQMRVSGTTVSYVVVSAP
jgi:hypothetical protein